MPTRGGQQEIGKNRAPRVHISYEVQTNNSLKKVELPFVMGVLSDLSGQSNVKPVDPGEREFEEFDHVNFKRKMAAIAPRASFVVENSLTGDGKLPVDLTFESLEDFSPGQVAKKVPALAKLLEARQQLQELMGMMDGKKGAQDLLDKMLKDPELTQALAEQKASASEPRAE